MYFYILTCNQNFRENEKQFMNNEGYFDSISFNSPIKTIEFNTESSSNQFSFMWGKIFIM